LTELIGECERKEVLDFVTGFVPSKSNFIARVRKPDVKNASHWALILRLTACLQLSHLTEIFGKYFPIIRFALLR